MHSVLVALEDLRDGLVLVSPDNEMEKLRNHALCDRIAATHSQVHSFVFVLMQHQDVKPFVFLFQRPLELDLSVFESHVEPFIFHVTDTVQCNLGTALSEENRDDLDIFNVGDFAEVIYVVILAHQVDITEVLEAAWVVVIAVDHENWHGNA